MNERTERHRFFARMLIEAMGLTALAGGTLAACGGNVIVDGGPSGDGGSGGSGGTGGNGGTGATGPTTGTLSTGTSSGCGVTGQGTPVDVCIPMDGDFCPPGDWSVVLQEAAKELGVCAEINGGDCCNSPNVDAVLCEWPPSGNSCCYTVDYQESGLCIGRPFTVDGAARSAAPVARSDWSRGLVPSCEDLAPSARLALADLWTADARAEHASVASFARLALELLAVGAPPDLLAGAQRAMGDEIRHAEVSFAFASIYGGTPVGPGPLAIEGAFGRTTLAEVAAATVREGCIGETIAALIAAEARDRTSDIAIRAALSAIATEEAEHAALAWRIVAWAWRTGDPTVRTSITSAFAAARVPVIPPTPDAIDTPTLHRSGRLTPLEMHAIATRALTEVITPTFHTLSTSPA